MQDISIKFVDFWPSLNCDDNKFINALKTKYNVRVIATDSPERPDILFYSLFGHEHYKYQDCVKVYFTGENDVPDFNECDYALSFHHIDFGDRHLRYPLYMLYEINEAINPPHITDDEALNRGFCTALVRNFNNCSPLRLQIIEAVDAYKSIAFGGAYRNNIGGNVPIDGKIDFIAKYKFNLALENTSIPGYVTEKIVEPFAANTVPIYWGAPDVALDFNPEAYIDIADYATLDAFIDDLRAIDNDPKRYLAMLRAPRLKSDASIDYNERLDEFLCKIAATRKRMRPDYAMGKEFYQRNRVLNTFFAKPRVINLFSRLLKK